MWRSNYQAQAPSGGRLRRRLTGRRVLGTLLPIVTAVALSGAAPAAPVGAAAGAPPGPPTTADTPPTGTYTNPVGRGVVDNFGDNSVVRGRDGFWYAYATQSLLQVGSDFMHRLPILRSPDLVSWEHVGDVFDTETNWPSWLGPKSSTWGAAVEYWDGQYRMYYVGVNIPGHDRPNKSLGVATAPTPAGPWTDSGEPLIAPQFYQRPPHDKVRERALIAPEVIQTPDGRRFLYYGGFNGGIWAVRLAADGMRVVGEPVMLVGDAHLEGPYLVRRGGWYYMFASANHCCLGGPVSGYSGWVARSKSPTGPFVDRDGVPVLADRPGGAPVIAPNGNKWMATGGLHTVTDLAGQDWLFYHSVDRAHPYLNGPFKGGLRRGLTIDRLDWIDGWPTVRGGKGASAGPQRAPSMTPQIGDAFESGEINSGTWQNATDWQNGAEPAGGFARAVSSGGGGSERVLWARRAWQGDTVMRAAVRTPQRGESGAVGLRLSDPSGATTVDVTVNSADRAVEVSVTEAGKSETTASRALPEGFDTASWHEITADVSEGELRVRLADVGAYHPVVDMQASLPGDLVAGRFGLLGTGATADVDDVTVTPAAVPHTELAPYPDAERVDPGFSDEFTSAELGEQWSWVRAPKADTRDGDLVFPVQQGHVIGEHQDASLVTRSAPDTDEWTVETKVDVNLGDEPLWGFPMAGLVVYAGDDELLLNVIHGRNVVRDARMVRDSRYEGRAMTGHAMTGVAGKSQTWLRLHHSVDPGSGRHQFRGASSLDGEHWTWTTTYTMPADTEFDIGLITAGARPDDPAFTARFDYLRVLRP